MTLQRTLLYVILLLLPAGLFAQMTPYYLADGLNNFEDQQLRGSSPVYVSYVTDDSLIISPESETLKHCSIYKRKQGESFFRRTRSFSSTNTNYACVDPNFIMLIQDDGSYLLFGKDQGQSSTLLSTDDKAPVLRVRDSLRTVIAGVNKGVYAANKKVSDEEHRKDVVLTKKILSGYLASIHSRRSDPVLARQIVKWSGNSTTVVYLMQENYSIIRNAFGEVLRKTIVGLIKYHTDGKCYLQWRTFGYESVGGGQFSSDMSTYNTTNYTFNASSSAGTTRMEEGQAYEVGCD